MLLCNYQTDNKYLMMDKNYIVGDLIYDAAIYDGLNTFLDDLEFYKKWLPKDKEARILELCCGTGRLTIPIAKEGYNITGVDYTTSMLNQAIAKAEKAIRNMKTILIESYRSTTGRSHLVRATA